MLTAKPPSVPNFGRRTRHAHARLPGWRSAGVAALLCSGVAWASLPRPAEIRTDEQRQWHALAITPLSDGGSTGLRMAPTVSVEPLEFVPRRAVAPAPEPAAKAAVAPVPLRIRGRAGQGLYWALRAAGASPQVAAQYLAALATEIDVGEVTSGDAFDLVLSPRRELLYAGLDRAVDADLQLVRWTARGRSQWIDAGAVGRPVTAAAGMSWPVAGRITSYFGNRRHPILRFTRFHAGIDFGARWGSPIVAAADGQIVRAGWAGGYGRQVRIAHAGGLMTSYSHMSQIAASPGSYVRQGQVIGYVGSSGFSTGPHLHYEVIRHGVKVNPLGVRFAGAPVVDRGLADAVKARLKALMQVGAKRG